MGSWSSALIAEGKARGRAKGMATSMLTYMRKEGATLGDALDYFEIREPERSAVVSWIEEHATPVAHDEPGNFKCRSSEPDL